MCSTTICLSERPIRLTGKVFYNDRRQRIDIKQPLRGMIGGTEKNAKYIMEIILCPKKLEQRVQELNEKKVQTVLLYFEEDKACDVRNVEAKTLE
jgi:hypothetical protein